MASAINSDCRTRAGLAAQDQSDTDSLQQLIPVVLDLMEAALAAHDEDLLSKGVALLLEVVERPFPILQPSLLRLVAVAGRAAACSDLDLAARGHCSQVCSPSLFGWGLTYACLFLLVANISSSAIRLYG